MPLQHFLRNDQEITTMPSRRPTLLLSILLLPLLLLSAPAALQAQELSVAFDPAEPIAGETFLVLVSGEGHGCYPGSQETTIEGNEATITFSDHCPIFTGLVEHTYRMELTLPTAGDWTVNVFNAFTDTVATSAVSVGEEPHLDPSRAAGATLLFPYFEVDPTDPGGRSSLVAIGNAAGTGTLARVILWTDRGIPTLAFDLFVNAKSVKTINLRDVFAGKLPETPHPVLTESFPYPSCSSPIHVPEVSPEALRAKHSGQPDPGDGLCSSTGHGPEGLAVGYMTVDVVRRCSNALPSDPGYFEGSEQVAGTRNVLWGDQFFVDAGQDFAQAFEAVAIPADVAAAEPSKTFWSFASRGEDARAMLPTTHLARATTEGAFDGGTDFLIWIEPSRTAEPAACDEPASDGCPVALAASFVAEQGSDAVEHFTVHSPPIAARWSVGGPELPVTTPSTVAELRAHEPTEFCTLPSFPLQMSVGTVMKAFGRFSVGFRGVGLPE